MPGSIEETWKGSGCPFSPATRHPHAQRPGSPGTCQRWKRLLLRGSIRSLKRARPPRVRGVGGRLNGISWRPVMSILECDDRVTVLKSSRDLRHQSGRLRCRAAIAQRVAGMLRDRLAGRARGSAFLRPLALRGGVEAPNPDLGSVPAHLVCRVCGRDIELGESVLFLRRRPAHLDCLYPPLASRASAVSPIQGYTTVVPLKNGRGIAAWDHRCRICGSTWRGVFM